MLKRVLILSTGYYKLEGLQEIDAENLETQYIFCLFLIVFFLAVWPL